jgi:hypothetical protein
MLWCKSARYAQHESHKLWTKYPVLNNTRSVITQKNTVLIYFAVEIWNHAILPLFDSNIGVNINSVISRCFYIYAWQRQWRSALLFVLHMYQNFVLKFLRDKTWYRYIYRHASIFRVSYFAFIQIRVAAPKYYFCSAVDRGIKNIGEYFEL